MEVARRPPLLVGHLMVTLALAGVTAVAEAARPPPEGAPTRPTRDAVLRRRRHALRPAP